ncbi:PAQR family membrane homeostasis protein TrhA [Marinithermus hydrothermalis]|uniref:Hly-III family protein n=1 Tax=Marinithermus hydrothermalis (strain DSM 14884 / JCM 11576 / T1) TaxID=869210 RepID=F2NN80_MARHT|nr:hemolysin III family protein [Marinithermus hydrothermalis]AEB12819.1 Hly-III family protein [Marinithermus hydrothermalis DSM 14884]
MSTHGAEGQGRLKNGDTRTINTWTHVAGAALAVLGTGVLLAVSGGKPYKIVGGLVFGLSMLLMYATSSLYHGVVAPARVLERLRQLDHAAIFLFIAGMYTPVVLAGLDPGFRVPVLAFVWGLAVLIYATRRPNPWSGVLGSYEFWHLAVLVLFAGERASG